jgi:Zn-dependent metalloprotease
MKKFISIDGLKALLLLIAALPLFLNAQVTLDKQEKSPVAMKFQAGQQPTVASFFQEYRQAYPLSDENQMQVLRVSQDQKGSHHRYDQYYKGVQVIGAQFILHETAGKIWFANGHLVHGLNMDVIPVLSWDQALKLALDEVGAQAYMWEKPGNEAILRKVLNDEKATYYPSGELKLTSGYEYLSSENTKLVWRFDIYAEQPLGRYWIDVNAGTGDIVYKENRIHNGDVPGSGESLYNGTVNMAVDEFVPGVNYRLHEYTTRPVTIQTYNLQNYWDYDHVVDFESASAFGPWDPVGVSAHFGIEATYDYFLAVHGRNSYDNLGGPLFSFSHYGVDYVNAFWNGLFMTFGDGDGINYFPLLSTDVIAHELTHGVTQYSSNLIYYCEAGALNESFSDIFGNLVEFYFEGMPGIGTGDWHMGEDFSADGLGFRNMADPNELWCPDTYYGDFWVLSNGGDNGGVHSNSCVGNFWFYLLTEGGSGTNDHGFAYDVTSIGVDDAAFIAYNLNNSYLIPISDYHDARTGSIAFAEFWFGAGSQEAASVADAWDAVGVYDMDVPANDLCENAIELFCNDVIEGTTIASTYDEDAPWCDFPHDTRGVWYQFAGNDHMMLASMCGGPVYDARMTVYSGTCEELTCVGANDDGCGVGNVSNVAFYAEEGTLYLILIHGYYGSDGFFQLSMTSLDGPAIATEPDEFNFIVPFQETASDLLTINSVGEDCMTDLVWWIYNLEPQLPLKYEPIQLEKIKENPVILAEGPKHSQDVKDGFGRNNRSTERMPPASPPVLIAGNASKSDRELTNNPVTVTITHSLDQSIMEYNSVACWNGVDATTDNSFWRAFNLLDFGISGNFEVSNVEIGLEVIFFVYTDLQLTVNLYTSEGGLFPTGMLNFIGGATYAIEEQAYTMLSLPVTGVAHVGSELVVEIFSPGGSFFIIGSNNLGQTGPSYLSAWECGFTSPIDLADLGFPDMHIVMNVTGTYENICPWLSVMPHIGVTPMGSSTDVSVMVDADGLYPGIYECGLAFGGNGTNADEVYIPVTMTVVDITPPVITVADPITLWPPNGKYDRQDLDELLVSIVDDVDGVIPVGAADITFATSDEPDDAKGVGDGKTINDIVILPDCKAVDLRRERDGHGNGRVYWVNVSVSDEAGNVATAASMVTVPHDMAGPAVDDGADHFVYSNCFGYGPERIATGIEDNMISDYELSVYPNPFNGITNIQFTLKEEGITTLDIYNMVGQKVASLFSGNTEAGHKYIVTFDGSNLPEGVYFYRLQSSGGISATDKIIQIR